MFVNEYVTKFTQLSHYAPHEVNTDEKKHECFLNGLSDGLAYALEARDFENFQGMVNKFLVLENHSGVMEHKRKLVRQHQPRGSSKPRVATSSVGPVFRPAQPQFQPRPHAAGQGFSTLQHQVIQRPNNLQTPIAENQSVQIIQATQDPQQANRRCYNYGEQGYYAIDAPIHALVSIILLWLHLPLPMEPTLFLLLPSRTTLMGESIMWLWKKCKKLLILSLVCFSSMTLLQ
jgi:hypothetical protein